MGVMDSYTVSESVHVEMRVGQRTIAVTWPAGPVEPKDDDERLALDFLLRTGHAELGSETAKPERRRRALAKEVDAP